MTINNNKVDALYSATVDRILKSQHTAGYFEGRLSDSALAAALASPALERGGRRAAAARGIGWLIRHQNADGGWGDTPDSPSNLATTLLGYCALQAEEGAAPTRRRAAAWLTERTGDLTPPSIARAVAAFYGKDRTFSGPILSVCALSGVLGPEPEAWRYVMQLPFEAACLPHGFYKWLRLPVVSYALPALIAIGLARHRKWPTRFGVGRWLRNRVAAGTLRKLQRIQPESGGYLEAIPLTAFVALNLMAAGEKETPVLPRCLDFLEGGQGPEGGWPIDTNLASWTTSLSVRVLAGEAVREEIVDSLNRACAYLLAVQQKDLHPFTNTEPGGWGWTYLSGSVPDGDDTAGALLALHALGAAESGAREAAVKGIDWLIRLQNRDGGIPTFCRGWLNLPFDQSCPDLTAHVLAAFSAWRPLLPERSEVMERAMTAAVDYLRRTQRKDGSWTPLWFGNQEAPHHENPVFGTARVVEGLCRLGDSFAAGPMIAAGKNWLKAARNDDGGWGGAPGVRSSLEETAVAVAALALCGEVDAVSAGIGYLEMATDSGAAFPARPIGLYFSSLWYSEDLYPVVFTGHALRVVKETGVLSAAEKSRESSVKK